MLHATLAVAAALLLGQCDPSYPNEFELDALQSALQDVIDSEQDYITATKAFTEAFVAADDAKKQLDAVNADINKNALDLIGAANAKDAAVYAAAIKKAKTLAVNLKDATGFVVTAQADLSMAGLARDGALNDLLWNADVARAMINEFVKEWEMQ